MEPIPIEDAMNHHDFPALRAHWHAQAALAGDLAQRNLDAWRQISDASTRLARQQLDASIYTSHELLHCADPAACVYLFIRQIHPAVERWAAWHDRVVDVIGGAQSEAAVVAEAYLPTARESAAAVVDELARLPGGAALPLWSAAAASA